MTEHHVEIVVRVLHVRDERLNYAQALDTSSARDDLPMTPTLAGSRHPKNNSYQA
jgi:hypothetical protein